MRTLGAVLAGGRSRRFGSDKAAAVWRGQPLIEHMLDTLRPVVEELVVCGRDVPGEVSLPDRPAIDLGPLGGLNAALAYAADNGFDRVLSVPCDVPALSPDLVARLLACDDAAFIADLPVIGIWPAGLSDALDRLLASNGSRAMRSWTDAIVASPLITATAELPVNVNRPADLAALHD